jgi:tRNA dimethylallyltransferase
LTEGLVKIPNIPIKFRNKIRSLHKKIGPKNFFLELVKLDPLVKKRINPLDTQRVIRAYEIKSFTKKSMYDFFKSTRSKYQQENFYKIFIAFPRDELVKKINSRSKEMIKKGLISEVKKFLRLKVPKKMTASKAIGVNEVRLYLDQKILIPELIEKISIKTRQYAKRQMTWGRGHMKNWIKLDSNSLNKF